MKLDRFDGGKSVRVDPSLILANEGVVYSNIDNTSLLLKSCKGVTITDTVVGGQFYNFKDTWLSSAGERSYVEYKDKLYYTEAGQIPRSYDGFRTLLLGIVAPAVKLTATQANPVATEKISASASVLQYTYTYYNSTDGIESAPAPISDELNLAADKVVDLSGFVASMDVQVDTIRIYRLGDNVTSMTLVKEVPNDSINVRDDVLTANLLAQILETYSNQQALSGLQYLTQAYGILFAAKGDKLYYTRTGIPTAWPSLNYIDFAHDITGLLPVSNGIIVFSRFKADILTGDDTSNFKVQELSDEQGCVSHLGCKKVKGIPVWPSVEGICSYSQGSISVVSKDKLDLTTLNVINAAVHNEQYHLNLVGGSLLVMDARFGVSYKDYLFNEQIDNILTYNGVLYARVGARLAKLFDGALAEFSYKSPNMTEAAHSVTKLYNNVYVRSSGEFQISIFIDGVQVHTETLSGNKVHDVKPPEATQRGSSIQIGLVGTGTVYEIEYKAVGRQNGR